MDFKMHRFCKLKKGRTERKIEVEKLKNQDVRETVGKKLQNKLKRQKNQNLWKLRQFG